MVGKSSLSSNGLNIGLQPLVAATAICIKAQPGLKTGPLCGVSFALSVGADPTRRHPGKMVIECGLSGGPECCTMLAVSDWRARSSLATAFSRLLCILARRRVPPRPHERGSAAAAVPVPAHNEELIVRGMRSFRFSECRIGGCQATSSLSRQLYRCYRETCDGTRCSSSRARRP